MHDKKLYGTASVGTKGQVVIPADARQALNIQPGDRLYVIGSEKFQSIGFIKEDQLRHMVEHLTSNIESFQSLLENTDKE